MIIIIPDIHEQWEKLDKVYEKYPEAEQYIHLGDYLDSFRHSEKNAHETLEGLSLAAPDERYVFLLGNHDLHYHYPEKKHLACSGYHGDSARLWEEYRRHLPKFKPYHWLTPNILLSHAGVDQRFVEDCGHTISQELEKEWHIFQNSNYTPGQYVPSMFDCIGRDRGGEQEFGGPFWADIRHIQPAQDVFQIVGHTNGKQVRIVNADHLYEPDADSVLMVPGATLCLDTNLNHIGIIRDIESEIIEIEKV